MVFGCICNINERVESNVPAGRREQEVGKLCATTSTRLLAHCFCISRDGSPSYLIQTSIAAR